jgi:copper chaperone
MRASYRIGGMTCGGCANAVTRAIKRLDPAARVQVDLAAGQVSVDGVCSREAVQSAVEAAGFRFEGPA